MRHVPLAALALAAAALSAACATVSPEERAAACRATDWTSYGYNDGLLGVPAGDRAEKFADCAALGHPADTAAYATARADGLAEYCTVENGYDAGRSGRRYHGVCPPELAQAFLQGYEQGRKERPVYVYPSFSFGFGYGHSPYWFGHRYWFPHHRRYHGHYRRHR